MPDYAELFLDAGRQAGRLELRGVQNGQLERRVYAGPRETAGNQGSGKVALYSAGLDRALAELFATPSKLARLQLKALTSDTAEEGPLLVDLVELGSDALANGSARWGYLKLRALRLDGVVTREIVRIGADRDNRRGSIHLRDANPSPTGFIALEVDDQGPFLFMSNGERTITVSPTGVEGWPDKGDWGFVADHPDDAGAEIHYNVLEGPEVGVYARGTARLSAGRALVALPDHFAHVASTERLTVQLTPRSGDSKGVAATRLTTRELEITELLGGAGEYDVDYAVHGLRKGRESFEVVRPRRRAVARAAVRPASEGVAASEGGEDAG